KHYPEHIKQELEIPDISLHEMLTETIANYGEKSALYLYGRDRKSTRLNSSHVSISYAVFCLKKKHINVNSTNHRPDRLANTPYVIANGRLPSNIGSAAVSPFRILLIGLEAGCARISGLDIIK